MVHQASNPDSNPASQANQLVSAHAAEQLGAANLVEQLGPACPAYSAYQLVAVNQPMDLYSPD